MKIEFKRLPEINKSEIIELLNHPLVRRHMPLAKDCFDDAAYDAFIADKEQLYWGQACILAILTRLHFASMQA